MQSNGCRIHSSARWISKIPLTVALLEVRISTRRQPTVRWLNTEWNERFLSTRSALPRGGELNFRSCFGAGHGRSSDLQAGNRRRSAFLLTRLPISLFEPRQCLIGRSFLFTAAGQCWIFTSFPFQHVGPVRTFRCTVSDISVPQTNRAWQFPLSENHYSPDGGETRVR